MVVVYRWNHATGESGPVDPNEPTPKREKHFIVMKSREAYSSPVSGEKIYGRRENERDLVRNNSVDQRDVPPQKEMQEKLASKRDRDIEKVVDDVADRLSAG